MAVKGVDFAWTQPSPAQVKAAGASWVAGYFSNDPTKNLTRAKVAAFLAVGIPVVTVWETTTVRATQGYAAGVSDAQAAEAQRKACGLPDYQRIYFAVDEDTSWPNVERYFAGVESVLGLPRVGTYGGYHIVEGAHSYGIPWLWQALAWSGGLWSAHANIRQEGGTLWGGSADVDYAETTDFGQTPRPEVDMPLTPADIKAVSEATATLLTDGPHRDQLAMANLYWWRRVLDPTIELPKSADAVVSQTAALRATVAAREAALNAAIKALADALAKAGGTLTAAEVQAAAQAGAEAALTQLGHVLDGTKA
jgi:hypothetical protein